MADPVTPASGEEEELGIECEANGSGEAEVEVVECPSAGSANRQADAETEKVDGSLKFRGSAMCDERRYHLL